MKLAKARWRTQIFQIMNIRHFSLLPHRSVIAVAGPDRADFLQGLISNDTRKVGPGRAIWAALLTPQGRFLNDMFVVEDEHQTFLLETERERAAALARKLKMYTLRSKVTVEDRSAALEVAVVFGPDAQEVVPVAGATAFVDPRLPELGVRVLAPAGRTAQLVNLPETPLRDYEALRLRLGVPDGSRDLPVEKALLLESGFDELHGVDWQKGCYMGQELTARTKYRGLIKRRLFPVRVEGPLPPAGTPIQHDGKEVGELRSGAGDRALAMLQLDAADGILTAGGLNVFAERPSWMQIPERT
jgi:folate-binding protein YgfZ